MSCKKDNLTHQIVTLKTTDKQGILDGLLELAKLDADFSGDNGDSYKWDCAKQFESNAHYAINQVKTIKNHKECINEFMNIWMANDGYYGQYDIDIIYDKSQKPIALSLAYTY